MIAEKKIRDVVRKAISESLGINDIVYKSANKIFSIIRASIENHLNDKEYTTVFDGSVLYIEGIFPFRFVDRDIMVEYASYIFNDGAAYRKYRDKYPKRIMGASTAITDNGITLFATCNKVGDKYDEIIYDKIQHELDHVLKFIRTEKVKLSDSELRSKVDRGIRMRQKDPAIFMASFILYCSRTYEQDAFANGLYNWLNNGKGDKNNIVHNSAIARYRRICLKYIQRLEQLIGNEVETVRIKNFFGISVGKIIKKGYNTCERLKNKANRVIYKYSEENNENVNVIK